jgi:hypothetical protein
MKNSWRGFCWVVVSLALAFGGAQRVKAQEVTATVTGTVVDSSGSALPGAVVNVKSVERGVVYTATTNDVGLYRIPQLPIGNYEVRVEKTGFSSVAYPAFTLSLNQVARIDVEMKVGQVTETVVVSGAAPILKTESTQVDTIIDAAT